MEAARFGVDQFRQRVHIRAFQLGKLPVIEYLLHHRVLRCQPFQNIGRRRDRFAFPITERSRQAHLLEQHFAELLRRRDVELALRQCVNFAGQPRDFRFEQSRQPRKLRRIHPDTGMFHARQHAGQRQFDVLIQPAQSAPVDFRP